MWKEEIEVKEDTEWGKENGGIERKIEDERGETKENMKAQEAATDGVPKRMGRVKQEKKIKKRTRHGKKKKTGKERKKRQGNGEREKKKTNRERIKQKEEESKERRK